MRPGFDPWVGKILWRREWQPIPVFLPGESHGQRSLVGYSPWGHLEWDTTEHHTRIINQVIPPPTPTITKSDNVEIAVQWAVHMFALYEYSFITAQCY